MFTVKGFLNGTLTSVTVSGAVSKSHAMNLAEAQVAGFRAMKAVAQ